MPLRYLYPSQFFDYWSNRRLKFQWVGKRKPERTSLRHISVNPYRPAIDSSSQRLEDGKKRDRRCMPLRYLFHSISVIISSDQPNTMIQYYLRWSMLKVSTGQGICHADICISIILWISTSDRKRRDTQWGVRASFKYLYLNELLLSIVQIGGVEGKEKHAAEKNVATWRGSHVSQIHQSTPVINYSDQSNRGGKRWSVRKKAWRHLHP